VSTAVLAGRSVRKDATRRRTREAPVKKKYVVDLDESRRGKAVAGGDPQGPERGARRLRRAHTLLLADEGRTDEEEIARGLHAGVRTIERTRKRFVEEGLGAALSERPRLGGALPRKLDTHQEAYLVALGPLLRCTRGARTLDDAALGQQAGGGRASRRDM